MWLRKKIILFTICILLFFSDESIRWIRTGRAQADEENSSIIYLPLVADETFGQDPPNFSETVFGVELPSASDWKVLPDVAEGGTSYTRINGVRWADIEPEEGQRNWLAAITMEEKLIAAAQHDIRVVLVVRLTPDWAQKVPGAICGPIKEDKLESFGNFMYDVVVRYSAAPYYVKYWEIYNEPDVAPELVMGPEATDPFGCWGDSTDEYYGGGYYATMLKTIYPKVKQANPEAQLMVGGLLMSCNPATGKCNSDEEILASKFFEGILANGGGNAFDGVAFHNYEFYMQRLGAYFSRKWDTAWDSTGPAVGAKTRFLRDLMEAYNVSGKFIMNTETALLCGASGDPPGSPGCEIDPGSDLEQTKAYYLTQSYAAAIAEGLKANIWYSLVGWRNSGLFYANYTPRPAYSAYQFARQKLGNVVYLGPITDEDTGGETNLLGYKFRKADGKLLWVVWSRDGIHHTIPLTKSPLGVWDTFGTSVAMSDVAPLTVTLKPLYIEFSP